MRRGAWIAHTGAGLALLAACAPAQAAEPRAVTGAGATLEAARAPAAQLERVALRRSFGVRFERYRQTVGGLPVLGSDAVVTAAAGRRGDLLLDRSRPLRRRPRPATLRRSAAVVLARRAAGARELRSHPRASLAVLPRPGGARTVPGASCFRLPLRSFEVLVDARTSAVLRIRDLLRHAFDQTGEATVFDTNPIVALGSSAGLADADDADSPELDDALEPVTLERLSDEAPCLEGQWAHATLPDGPDGDEDPEEVCDAGRDFEATRSDPVFEAAMAYFHVDRVQQLYLRETLGFADVMARQLRVHVNDFEEDNSFNGEVSLGAGGTDDGEDGEVIVHEYGHAIQDDQAPGFGGSGEGGAIGEGFSDYLVAAVSRTFVDPARPALDACVAEWDELGFLEDDSDPIPLVPCLRQTDTGVSAAQVGPGTPCDGEVHCAGEAWSGALWKLRAQIGALDADRLVIQSHFSLSEDAGFHEGGLALIAADHALFGGIHEGFLRALLIERGLLDVERFDDEPASARPLPIPGSATGRLEAGDDDHDVYALALTAGRPVVLRLASSAEELDLRLLRPGTASVADGSGVVAAAETTGSNERIAFTPTTSGVHYLDVAAIAGSGEYAIATAHDADGDQVGDGEDNCASVANTAQGDRDRDGPGDACDNCPGAGNAAQVDWDRDARGDRCDRSARIALERLGKRGRRIRLRATVRPAHLRPSAVRVRVRQRVCRPRCRWRPVRTRVAKRRAGEGRTGVVVRVRRKGRYRLRATLKAPRYARASSRRVVVRVR